MFLAFNFIFPQRIVIARSVEIDDIPLSGAFQLRVLCAEGLRRRREWAVLWGLLAAGGFYFLGFIDTAYNLWNGMYRTRSAAMAAEVAINVFCFTFATWLAALLWKHRRTLGD